jgi:hypothetical protein
MTLVEDITLEDAEDFPEVMDSLAERLLEEPDQATLFLGLIWPLLLGRGKHVVLIRVEWPGESR